MSSLERREPVVGRVLYERFLVERDLTDYSIGGGFTVYQVKDLKNFCRRAMLKSAMDPAGDSGEAGPTFQQVCESLMQLGHNGIEEVLETGRLFDGRPYAVTRFYEGAKLASFLSGNKRLELKHTAEILLDVSEALASAHQRGILHCDLRPENVLLDRDSGRPRILAFGSAWPIDVRGKCLSALTPGSEALSYAAPELLAKLGHRSPASDVYSFSVLAYRLVSGSVPYLSEDRAEMLRVINSRTAIRPTNLRTDLSAGIDEIIFSGLDFEPRWRPKNIADLGLRMARALDPPRGIVISPGKDVSPSLAEIPEIATIPEQKPSEILPVFSVPFEASLTDPRKRRSRTISDRSVAWSLIGLLLAGALSLPIGQSMFEDSGPERSLGTVLARSDDDRTRREVRYSIGGTSARGNASAGGAEIDVVSDAPGFLYVFNETTDGQGQVIFRPQDVPVDGSGIEAGKELKVLFKDISSSEGVWLVWTAVKNPEMENLRGSAVAATDENGRKLRHFLERNRDLRVQVNAEGSGGNTVLTGSGDRLVHRIELPVGDTLSQKQQR